MPGEGLTGSRIRERRLIAGLRQADLARSLGISASYLNLIEHNRRRIGGKLLLDIARSLGVEPSVLTEGAEATLIATLREAATDADLAPDEAARAEELAGRFPGWSDVLARAHRRIAALERAVETLNDRLTHDPQLAASVHELLSTAAAIRSTASILADEKDLDAEWRDRFHANLNQDSRRLADSSKALVEYFETGQGGDDTSASPQDELDAFLTAHDWRFDDLESGSASPEEIVAAAPELRQQASKNLATGILTRFAEDAESLSLSELETQIARSGADPVALARQNDLPVTLVMRRMAGLQDPACAVVICDRSGSITFRKPAGQLVIPRYAPACPLWPLFAALHQPGLVLHRPVIQLGRGRAAFECFAAADIRATPAVNMPPLTEATMLLVPVNEVAADAINVGSTCRVCPAEHCPGRREPSILREEI